MLSDYRIKKLEILKKVLDAKVHYDMPLSENKMYREIEHRR